MKTNSKFLICLLLVSFMTASCYTKIIEPNPPPIITTPPDQPWDFEEGVYVAGSGFTSDKFVAKVWGKNYSFQFLSEQNSSTAASIFLYGDDVYVAGSEDRWSENCCFPSFPTYAMLWKNGVPQPLTEIDLDSRALSVFVSNDNVYVAGDIQPSIGQSTATLWINGVAHALSDGKFSASATSVFVSNDDIYVAGYDGDKAILWKNGVPESLTDGLKATSVFVVDTEVYVAGKGSKGAEVWRNGVAQTLFSDSDNSYALSVYVVGEDVYVAGSEYTNSVGYYEQKAIVWKNGSPLPFIDDQYTIANSISVSGGDVYVVGSKGNMAVLWKNGVAKSLGVGSAFGLYIRK